MEAFGLDCSFLVKEGYDKSCKSVWRDLPDSSSSLIKSFQHFVMAQSSAGHKVPMLTSRTGMCSWVQHPSILHYFDLEELCASAQQSLMNSFVHLHLCSADFTRKDIESQEIWKREIALWNNDIVRIKKDVVKIGYIQTFTSYLELKSCINTLSQSTHGIVFFPRTMRLYELLWGKQHLPFLLKAGASPAPFLLFRREKGGLS